MTKSISCTTGKATDVSNNSAKFHGTIDCDSYRIAHNQVIDYFRAQRQNRAVTEAEAGFDMLGTLKFAERTIEDDIVCAQIEQDIRALVSQLPEEQREVVMMRYYAGMSFKEIAEQTDVSINTALGRMRYALINLRRMIKEKNLVLS